MADESDRCAWITLHQALEAFARAEHGVRGQRHIRPLHWYIACRLCVEGGFHPDTITPRPPFRVEQAGSGAYATRKLHFEPGLGRSGEMAILGGLKTKQVDVVVALPHIGPAIAVSMKGTLNAFRNLTNRMEEAGGDCTNLHITYPSLVYAFWHVVRGNRAGKLPSHAPADFRRRTSSDAGIPADVYRPNDVAIDHAGRPVASILRYHDAMAGLSGRAGIRNDVSRYEAIALTVVSGDEDNVGDVYEEYPAIGDALHFERFMPAIYEQYDLRFVYRVEDRLLRPSVVRLGWEDDSPALQDWAIDEYSPRWRDTADNDEL